MTGDDFIKFLMWNYITLVGRLAMGWRWIGHGDSED